MMLRLESPDIVKNYAHLSCGENNILLAAEVHILRPHVYMIHSHTIDWKQSLTNIVISDTEHSKKSNCGK